MIGKSLAHFGGPQRTLRIPADGSRVWETMLEEAGELAADGRHFLVVTGANGSPISSANPETTEIWLQPVDDAGARRKMLGGDHVVYPSGYSPDGEYLLYYSVQSDISSTFLTRFPEFTGRWKVSVGDQIEGESFAPDGSAIYYCTEEELFRVAFDTGPNPVLGRPERVAALPAGARGEIEIHPDGDSYLIAIDERRDAFDSKQGVKVVENWSAKLSLRR